MAQKILIASTEGSLLMSRFMLFQAAGYNVVPAYTWAEFEKAFLSDSPPGLVLIGQSTVPSQKCDMEAFVQKHYPETKLIELYLHSASTGVQHSCNARELAPEGLLGLVQRVLGEAVKGGKPVASILEGKGKV